MSENEGERNDEFGRINEDAVSKLRFCLSLDSIIGRFHPFIGHDGP
jgi:hypothetical protein